MLFEQDKIRKALARKSLLKMSQGDWPAFRSAKDCDVCDKLLGQDLVRDHCHITGKYREAAHSECNLKLQLCPKGTTIPVVFHNLRGCDSHLIMQVMSKAIADVERGEDEGDDDYENARKSAENIHKLKFIPNNTEKYISFSLGQLRFIDSAQFLLGRLDRLVSSVTGAGAGRDPLTITVTTGVSQNQQPKSCKNNPRFNS